MKNKRQVGSYVFTKKAAHLDILFILLFGGDGGGGACVIMVNICNQTSTYSGRLVHESEAGTRRTKLT